MTVVYPLFVLLDDQTMMTIKEPAHILSYLEGIDIENNEYRFGDSTEKAVRITVELTKAYRLFAHWKVVDVFHCESTMTLRDAFLTYADRVNLPRTLVQGKPAEIMERIEGNRPKKKNWFTGLFSL
jgi:hypothetical protein